MDFCVTQTLIGQQPGNMLHIIFFLLLHIFTHVKIVLSYSSQGKMLSFITSKSTSFCIQQLSLLVLPVIHAFWSLQLPYLRWKRFAVVAALCILAVRAVIVQLAFFLHIQASLPVVSLKSLQRTEVLVICSFILMWSFLRDCVIIVLFVSSNHVWSS